mgnify:CR=1 FL=1
MATGRLRTGGEFPAQRIDLVQQFVAAGKRIGFSLYITGKDRIDRTVLVEIAGEIRNRPHEVLGKHRGKPLRHRIRSRDHDAPALRELLDLLRELAHPLPQVGGGLARGCGRLVRRLGLDARDARGQSNHANCTIIQVTVRLPATI